MHIVSLSLYSPPIYRTSQRYVYPHVGILEVVHVARGMAHGNHKSGFQTYIYHDGDVLKQRPQSGLRFQQVEKRRVCACASRTRGGPEKVE